jgi:GrxC family glutaredoxin
MSHKVQIYSKFPCPYCIRAKEFFNSKNIAFEEIDLTGNYDEIDKLKERTGHRTFPQIFINDQFVGGYSDLMEKIEDGSLKI